MDSRGVIARTGRSARGGANGRGKGCDSQVGAVQEGILRRSFLRNGVHHDQVLWGIVAQDWRLQRLPQQAPSLVN